MSVIAVRVYEDKIKVSSDTILLKGNSITPNSNIKFSKVKRYNDMIVGAVGGAEESSLFFHYIETHKINNENINEKGILDFMLEFKNWKSDMSGDKSINNEYIIVCKGLAFAIEHLFVFKIEDYYAIGGGANFAHGAMYMGASPKEAVKASCYLCAVTSEPIINYTMKNED